MKRMKCWPIDATVQRARRLVVRINPIDSDWNLPENQQSSANDQFPALESPSLSGPLKTVLFLQFLYFRKKKETQMAGYYSAADDYGFLALFVGYAHQSGQCGVSFVSPTSFSSSVSSIICLEPETD